MTRESGTSASAKAVKARMRQWTLITLFLCLVWYLFVPVKLKLVYIGYRDTDVERVPLWDHITSPGFPIEYVFGIAVPSDIDFSNNYLLVSSAKPIKYLTFTRVSRLLWRHHDAYHGCAVYDDEFLPKRRYLYLTSRRYYCFDPE